MYELYMIVFIQEDKEKEIKAQREEALIQKEMVRLRKELEEERQRNNKEKFRFLFLIIDNKSRYIHTIEYCIMN